ncbi:MAG: hypothetical protein BWY05_01537 [Euryarchaeota archaeon ADurb.Bin165]|nr:MAG: hypothetical protein BWY05_01537 [Euryarchaeota archaeon ADurb.Bin165]
MHPGVFRPYSPEKFGTSWNLHSHDLLNTLAVGCSVDKAAYTTYTLRDEDIILEIPLFDKFFKATVNITDRWNRLHHPLILKDKVKVNRLRKDRMLWPEWHNYLSTHAFPPVSSGLLFTTSIWGVPNGWGTLVLIKVPL